jgi:hypothetical protein
MFQEEDIQQLLYFEKDELAFGFVVAFCLKEQKLRSDEQIETPLLGQLFPAETTANLLFSKTTERSEVRDAHSQLLSLLLELLVPIQRCFKI